MKKLTLAFALTLLVGPAWGQALVTTQPLGGTSGNGSSTITVTDTFQSIWSAQPSRHGCTIQNNGAATMYVYAGAIAGATKDKSVQLATGQSYACGNAGGTVLSDQISITGTSTQKFYANQW